MTEKGEHPIDVLVLATGFDAISGSMLQLRLTEKNFRLAARIVTPYSAP